MDRTRTGHSFGADSIVKICFVNVTGSFVSPLTIAYNRHVEHHGQLYTYGLMGHSQEKMNDTRVCSKNETD